MEEGTDTILNSDVSSFWVHAVFSMVIHLLFIVVPGVSRGSPASFLYIS